jgi:hypothetical protein
MATTTPNFGWTVPTSTDLVKNGATAIETLGDSIDASFVGLKGGTTGQVLSKSSGTDLAFTWVAADDSNAIQNSIVDAKGDLIGATANDTPARLAVGTNGQVLTADSTAATGLKWGTAASGLTLISATACSAVSSQAVTSFSSTYENYRLIVVGDGTANGYLQLRLRASGTDSTTGYAGYVNRYFSTNSTQTYAFNPAGEFEVGQADPASTAVVDILRPNLATRTSFLASGMGYQVGDSRAITQISQAIHTPQTAYDGINVIWTGGAFTGTIYIYGYQKA